MALNPKQQRFAQEYLVDLNAKQAAIRAGYSPKTAKQQGNRLLTHADVVRAIAEGQAARSERTQITADMVVEELGRIGFANMLDYIGITTAGDPFVDLSALTREQAAAISEVVVEDFTEKRGEDTRDVRRVRFKLSDKRAALVDLGKHLGLFPNRHEHTGANGGPIETRDVTEDELSRLPPEERRRVIAQALAAPTTH